MNKKSSSSSSHTKLSRAVYWIIRPEPNINQQPSIWHNHHTTPSTREQIREMYNFAILTSIPANARPEHASDIRSSQPPVAGRSREREREKEKEREWEGETKKGRERREVESEREIGRERGRDSERETDREYRRERERKERSREREGEREKERARERGRVRGREWEERGIERERNR
jgi:hypothetical protein